MIVELEFLFESVSSGQLVLYQPDVGVDVDGRGDVGCSSNRNCPQPATRVFSQLREEKTPNTLHHLEHCLKAC